MILKMCSYIVQGRHATQDEITACAYQAVNVDNKYNGAPVQVRVTMGKEPRHFLAMFKGKLIIYEVNYTYMVIYTVVMNIDAHYMCCFSIFALFTISMRVLALPLNNILELKKYLKIAYFALH